MAGEGRNEKADALVEAVRACDPLAIQLVILKTTYTVGEKADPEIARMAAQAKGYLDMSAEVAMRIAERLGWTIPQL